MRIADSELSQLGNNLKEYRSVLEGLSIYCTSRRKENILMRLRSVAAMMAKHLQQYEIPTETLHVPDRGPENAGEIVVLPSVNGMPYEMIERAIGNVWACVCSATVPLQDPNGFVPIHLYVLMRYVQNLKNKRSNALSFNVSMLPHQHTCACLGPTR